MSERLERKEVQEPVGMHPSRRPDPQSLTTLGSIWSRLTRLETWIHRTSREVRFGVHLPTLSLETTETYTDSRGGRSPG